MSEAAEGSRIVKVERPGWVAIELPFDTLPKLFWQRVKEQGDAVMMRQKDLGLWRAYTWREVAQIVREIGAGLVSLGFAPGEVVSVLSNTRREWVWADLAALSMGGVVNGIYPTDAPGQVEYLCSDSQTAVLFVEDDEQLDKVLEVRDRLPALRQVIVFDMDGLSRLDDARVMSLDALRERGRQYLAIHPELLDERLAARGPHDLAILVYTSGTTGRSKGAMMTHANLLNTLALAPNGLFDGFPAGGEQVAFLPLCHIAERNFGEYIAILRSAVVNFVENPETVFENLREVQPHAFLAVPRVWEKLYSSVAITVKEAGRLQQAMYRWAVGTGLELVRHAEAGTAPGPALKASAALARMLVLNNVRRMMGLSRVKVALTGAAPISPELIRWYRALGVPMREAWGMTETCGAGTISPRDAVRIGSIGLPGPGIEMRVSGEGEILLRSASVFKGYLNQPQKTAETIDPDGWLHTGDVGRVDDDGYFYITDRMKDIIITAGGKNVTPSEWENQLKFSPYVTDAVVIGDKRPFLTCLVMIDQDNVERWALDRNVAFSDYRSLTRAPEVIELIGAEIARVNAQFARVEQIKQFRLIENRLTAEDEELTPTMKLKRSLVNRKYADLIEAMYADRAAA